MVCSLIGLAFWKSPQRVIYAVLENDVKTKLSQKRKSKPVIIDSEDEDLEPRKKKHHLEDKLNTVLEEVASLKDVVTDAVDLTKEAKIPIALIWLMRDNFKCRMCLRIPLKLPVIVSKCCKVILGCQECVDGWYKGEDLLSKMCPSCRTERGYNETMILRGLDDFLKDIKQMIQNEAERQDEEDNEELPPVIP